ncbi:type IV secretory system conjugative DNA transfer family protein [Mariniblastus fucicola]|uniref:AAA-like domain protein n=1 Tax=Mariniblastus fucicola TaxID=980251 RepID=A0A5B9P393_9BACT|nr:type IV secretion system DNA-binding domain-containing protein [Mariniblastus fucicola]QEG21017.1 AAA-like domain protein [Mariniblastus fucicola]
MRIRLGKNSDSSERISIDDDLLRTHMHLVGATGAGKTTAIHAILRQLMSGVGDDKSCIFVIDPMGNLSRDLLKIMAYERYVTNSARERLLYIEPAREDVVTPFNPLHYTTEANRYYQTMRAVDLVLRAWEAQDVAQQPRLLQWTYKAFCAAAQVGFPISICRFLLHPGSDYHKAIINRIPGEIGNQWQQILHAKGGEAVRILESTRNRLDPFFESPNLRMMFGVQQNRFDCERMIRERKIVIVNLAKQGNVPGFISDTVGALMLNEIFETASRLAVTEGRSVVEPTYIFLDEFQRYVSGDIEDALPTVRQMGLRLILAHQSFAQLEREDVDLEQMIWQARTRLAFASYQKDADIIADEIAKMTFNDMEIKDKRTSKRQLIDGYKKEILRSWSESTSDSASESKSSGQANNSSQNSVYPFGESSPASTSRGSGSSENRGSGESMGRTAGRTSGESEHLTPNHVTFDEVSNVTYRSFEEHSLRWGKRLRSLKAGEAMLQTPGSADIKPVKIDHLRVPDTPEVREKVERLLEKNFASDFFMKMEDARREHELCLQQIVDGALPKLSAGKPQAKESDPHRPFTL